MFRLIFQNAKRMELDEDNILDSEIDNQLEQQLQDTIVTAYIKQIKTIQLFVAVIFGVAGLGAWLLYLDLFDRFYRMGISFWTDLSRHGLLQGAAFIGATVVITAATVAVFLLLLTAFGYRNFLKEPQQTTTYIKAQKYNTLFWKAFLLPAVICTLFVLWIFITEFSRIFFDYRFF